MQLKNLAEYVFTDQFYIKRLEKKIQLCIRQANTKISRRITAKQVMELSLLPQQERDLKVLRLKNIEIFDAFLSKNSVSLGDRKIIEGYPTLEEGIDAVYNQNSNYERIKEFIEKERKSLSQMANKAEKMRLKYIKDSTSHEIEKEILKALTIAPLGSPVMWEIIYDLYQNNVKIGNLGTPIKNETFEEIKNDKAEVCYNQGNHPMQGVAGY